MSYNKLKYKNLILVLCEGMGGVVDGKKKLAKLLYYVDFDRYEYKESMKSVTGDIYKAWKMGPVPNGYMDVVEELVKEGRLSIEERECGLPYKQECFVARGEADRSCFDDDDMAVIEHVIRKYGGLSGKQLEALTHQEAPWLSAELNEEIAYEMAFYRETDFSDVGVSVA